MSAGKMQKKRWIQGIFWRQNKKHLGGFSGGSVVKNPPSSGGDGGSIPGPGRAPVLQNSSARVPWLLSLCCRARELNHWAHIPQLVKPRHPRACTLPAHCDQEEPLVTTAREKARTATRPTTTKNKQINKIIKKKKKRIWDFQLMQNSEVSKSSSPKIRIKLDKLPKTISGIWKLPKDK